MGYFESLKAYRIYFLGYKKIDISRDVIFDEGTAYNKSRKRPAEEPEEAEAPRIHDTTMNEETQEEDQEVEEPQRPVDPPLEKNPHKRKPAWVCELIQGAERYGDPKENHRERKRTRSCSRYVALLCDFIDKEPSNYEEAVEWKEWKDAMIEEYQSIMKNDVWDVVPRPNRNSVVTSKWIYKIKHATDGSIEKYKVRFVARGNRL